LNEEVFGVSEALVVISRLKNINDEIMRKNYYVAFVRYMEFQSYNSEISAFTMTAEFQRETEDAIRHIIAQAESQMKELLASFTQASILGSAVLDA
jgi:hypothetical protein